MLRSVKGMNEDNGWVMVRVRGLGIGVYRGIDGWDIGMSNGSGDSLPGTGGQES